MRNSSRTWLHRENAAFAAGVGAGATVLDAGAGEQPYRELFAHCRYEAADFEKVDKPYAKSTYVCCLDAIPVEDGRFDAILFNQVMEHLPQPELALTELNRVMKEGGAMICTAPFFFAEHEQPYDFFRYTQVGWRYLLEKTGWEVVRLDWLEGYFGTLAYQLRMAAGCLPARPAQISAGLPGFVIAPLFLIAKPIFRLFASLLSLLDEKHRFKGRGHPKNYVVVVRKPAPQEKATPVLS